MKQNNHQQALHYIVLGKDDSDNSYLILQYNLIQTSEAEVCWCYANQLITVGEVVRGKLQPSVEDPKVIGGDESPTSEHQADSLPTLLVEQ
ncbi:MAG: hypothetical protein HC862_26000 [Scytonema sp. RU_4_4]|nr:hypothetical protein [Scytonema sp. RU_4_4]